MNAWVTVVATVAGAIIALGGQYVAKRGETRTRRGELLMEQCAQVVALSDEFRSRVWEEDKLGKQGQVDAWDLGGYRLAAARIKILSDDVTLVAALEELTESGKRLGTSWRRGERDPDELQRFREIDKATCHHFVKVSEIVVKRYLGERN
jgi:hypothetical protein